MRWLGYALVLCAGLVLSLWLHVLFIRWAAGT